MIKAEVIKEVVSFNERNSATHLITGAEAAARGDQPSGSGEITEEVRGRSALVLIDM